MIRGNVFWSFTMTKLGRYLAVCSLMSAGTAGVSLWAQQPRQERTHPSSVTQPDRSPQSKRAASAKRKFGPAHVVEPPDLLLVEVLEALPGRPISGERLVRPDGSISLGFYGDVQVGGLTLPEIKEKIVRHLQKYLTDETLGLAIIDPESGEPRIDPATRKPMVKDAKDTDCVFVDVTAYNSQNYYVQGDVYTPGRLPFTGNETVLDVINFAGGLLPSADRSKVKLIRSYPKGSPIQVLPIDYEEVTMGTDASTNYVILPNDRLVVPSSPDYDPSPSSTGSSRSSRPRARQMVRDSGYFPSLALDQGDQQSSSLRAVEKHLSEVEKKLDKILERLERSDRKSQNNATEKAASAAEGVPPESGDSPFSDGSDKPAKPRGSDRQPAPSDSPFGGGNG